MPRSWRRAGAAAGGALRLSVAWGGRQVDHALQHTAVRVPVGVGVVAVGALGTGVAVFFSGKTGGLSLLALSPSVAMMGYGTALIHADVTGAMSKEHLRRERDRGLQVITVASSPLGLAVTAVAMGTGADAAEALTLGDRTALLEAVIRLQFSAITALGRHLRVHSRAGSVGLAGQGGVAGDGRAALVPNKATDLGYDISRWGYYGLPSDGYFVRTLTPEQYRAFRSGRDFDFGGRPVDGYPGGMGFIGSAEEVRLLTTARSYREALRLDYEPRIVMEFQLRDPTGLQNVLRAPYAEFVPGGKTGAGFSEWNLPGISSRDIVNPRVRVLE